MLISGSGVNIKLKNTGWKKINTWEEPTWIFPTIEPQCQFCLSPISVESWVPDHDGAAYSQGRGYLWVFHSTHKFGSSQIKQKTITDLNCFRNAKNHGNTLAISFLPTLSTRKFLGWPPPTSVTGCLPGKQNDSILKNRPRLTDQQSKETIETTAEFDSPEETRVPQKTGSYWRSRLLALANLPPQSSLDDTLRFQWFLLQPHKHPTSLAGCYFISCHGNHNLTNQREQWSPPSPSKVGRADRCLSLKTKKDLCCF